MAASNPTSEVTEFTLQIIASSVPYFPFKGVDKFYDISGILSNPIIFQSTMDCLVSRYQGMNIDLIAGLDARGFIFGAPLSLALRIPFCMLRKKGKLPNSVSGEDYRKEYVGDDASGGDALCVSRSIASGNFRRVLVLDDLLATGGTLIAACDLLMSVGMVVVECGVVVEIRSLQGKERVQQKYPSVSVYSLIPESLIHG